MAGKDFTGSQRLSLPKVIYRPLLGASHDVLTMPPAAHRSRAVMWAVLLRRSRGSDEGWSDLCEMSSEFPPVGHLLVAVADRGSALLWGDGYSMCFRSYARRHHLGSGRSVAMFGDGYRGAQ